MISFCDLPLELIHQIAGESIQVYYNLALSYPAFARVVTNMTLIDYIRRFKPGITRSVAVTLPNHTMDVTVGPNYLSLDITPRDSNTTCNIHAYGGLCFIRNVERTSTYMKSSYLFQGNTAIAEPLSRAIAANFDTHTRSLIAPYIAKYLPRKPDSRISF